MIRVTNFIQKTFNILIYTTSSSLNLSTFCESKSLKRIKN